MSSTQCVLLPVIILLIYLINVEASLNQKLCFPSTLNKDGMTVFDAYEGIIETMTSLQFENTSDCTTTTLPDINNNIHDCFSCTLEPTTTLDETSRYKMLYDINGDIDSIKTNPALPSLAYITYASADHAAANSRCTDYSYPRICRFDLAALSISNSITQPFFFTLALNLTSGNALYEMQYGDATNGPQTWFGVGFGINGMFGDSAVFTSGILGQDPLQINDYNLTKPPNQQYNSKWKDSVNNFFDQTQAVDNDEWIVTAKRAMNTNDANDIVFTGTEESLPIFAAAGTASSQGKLQTHSATRYVSSVNVLLVPSPETSDNKWCTSMTVGNCIIAVDPAQTNHPTTNPTKAPTNMPSIHPSMNPSKIPTSSPTKAPSMDPTASPVKTADNVNQMGLFMVFTVVIIAICSN